MDTRTLSVSTDHLVLAQITNNLTYTVYNIYYAPRVLVAEEMVLVEGGGLGVG